MAHGKRQATRSLDKQVYDTLQEKNGFGRSKHEDKALGVSSEYIYSFSSMKTYLKHCCYFTDWCRQQPAIRDALGHKPRTLDECKPYVEAWIRAREQQGLSAYTVKMELSALQKLYGENFGITTKSTKRADITRSRGEVGMDKHFSVSKNEDMINACQHVGFRRSELAKAKGSDLVQQDGQWYVKIVGKGGRERLAPVLNNDQKTVDYIKSLSGHNKVHSAADIHSYRADYATSIYNKHKAADLQALKGQKIDYTALTGKRAKDGSRIYKSALYVCRNDRKGTVLDRAAMIRASRALGHNRESVVGEHYLRVEP